MHPDYFTQAQAPDKDFVHCLREESEEKVQLTRLYNDWEQVVGQDDRQPIQTTTYHEIQGPRHALPQNARPVAYFLYLSVCSF